jgi:hypothetical protein
MLFLKLIVIAICIALLSFALLPEATLLGTLKILAGGMVASIAITAFYPEVRGVKQGDTVSVVKDSAIPSIIGRLGRAAAAGRKNDQIKIMLGRSEVVGVIESYSGLISHPKIRIIYEEKLVE